MLVDMSERHHSDAAAGARTRAAAAEPPVPPPAYDSCTAPRGAFAASVVTASLLVGAGAGVAGAAAWQEWSPNGADTSSSSPNASAVVDRGDAPAADGSVEQVAHDVLPSVVKINVAGPEGAGSGSGIIISSDGEILTNNHVVEVAGDERQHLGRRSPTARAPKATIVGTDPLTDTAVIKAEDVSGLTAGHDRQVVATSTSARRSSRSARPFGLESTVTSGIVSALNRPVNVGTDDEGNATTYPAIQTDAAINPGNSGGPLVDMNGDVVGINSSIRTSSSSSTEEGGSIGLGFAIPIDEVMPIVEQMKDGETPTHARLGISVSDVAAQPGEVAAQGAQIEDVTSGSIADSRRPQERRRHHQDRRHRDHRRRLPGRHRPVLPARRRGHRDLPPRRRHRHGQAQARLRRVSRRR